MCAPFNLGDIMNTYMKEAIKEAKKAYLKEEIPVGAIIVHNNKIISRAHNTREKECSVIAHAEINAIEKACKKLKTRYLNECLIYITLEPCLMCLGAILEAHIKNIVYLAKSPKYGAIESKHKIQIPLINKIQIVKEDGEEEIIKMLESFFEKKRKM